MGKLINRGLQVSLFALAAISLAFATGGSSRTYAQSNGAQCAVGFYQYADGLLKSFEPLSGAELTIGSNVAGQLQSALPSQNQDLIIDASGYNTLDGLIYSLVIDPIDTDDPEHNGQSGGSANTQRPNYVHLAVTDPATGVVTDLGEPVLASASGYNLTNDLASTQKWYGTEWRSNSIELGTMHNGFLYVAIGGSNDSNNDVYKIDVTTNTYEVISISYGTENAPGTVQLGGDFVYLDGFIYAIEGAHTSGGYDPARFVRIDLATGTGDAVDMLTLPEQDRTFGSMWLALDGTDYRMFTHDDASGLIYEITNFVSGLPTATVVSSLASVGDGDGISCGDAAIPEFAVDAVDDSTTTFVDTSADIDLVFNDTGNVTYTVVAVDSDSTQGGTVLDNSDGTVSYTPASGFLGDDTFTYQVCLDGVTPSVCDSAEVTVTVEEEPVDEPADDDSGGSVLGATTDDDNTSTDEGQVLGEGDVLAETGMPGFVSVLFGLSLISISFIVLWLTPRSYAVAKQDR